MIADDGGNCEQVIAVDGGDCDSLTLPPPPGAAPDALKRRRGDHGLWVRDDQDECDGSPVTAWDQGHRPGPPRIFPRARSPSQSTRYSQPAWKMSQDESHGGFLQYQKFDLFLMQGFQSEVLGAESQTSHPRPSGFPLIVSTRSSRACR